MKKQFCNGKHNLVNKMKINLLIYHLDLGGVEKTAVEFANELVELGHDVTITTIYKFKPQMFDIDPRVKLRKNLGFYFKGLNSIVSLIPRKILYSSFAKGDYDLEIAFQAELPTDIIANSSNSKSRKYAWIHGIGMQYSDVYNKFDKIVFVSYDVKKHYAKSFINTSDENLKVVYNPMNFSDISEKSKVSEKTVAEGRIRFISVGRLSEEKRFDRLIDAFSRVKEKTIFPIELEIVGSGPEESILKQKINDSNLKETVKLVGYQKNPYKFMINADVYVCSSDYEGFNVAVTEAGYLGLPILTTNVYGAKELLGANEYGLSVDLTEDAIVDGMIKMLDSKTREHYSSIISNRVEELFVHQRTKQLLQLFADEDLKD
ncbi:glycosyltransferase [Erysipelothrix aquatica]